MSLLLLALLQKSPDLPLKGPAAACGTEIPWTTSLDQARARAKETGRPILWWVPYLDDSPMDRKRVVEKYMLAGPWMMPRVVELVRERFVPLRLVAAREHRKSFGLAPLEVVEPALLFLDAELRVSHRVDRLSTFHEDWFVHLLRGALKLPPEERVLDDGRRALAEGRPDPALFARQAGDEARWYEGVALSLTGRHDEATKVWRSIKEGRWAAKAAAELDRDGPFSRGFEVYEAFPPLEGLPTSSTRPRATADPARAVRFLVGLQRPSGVWDDSHYHFGGDDSLPNVYMAVTALAARALREWNGPERAIARAEAYLKDDAKLAVEDTDEIAWAQIYRLSYFARTKDVETSARIARKLLELQRPSGAWAHEYDNPFVTASALLALDEARAAGVDVPAAPVRKGVAALAGARDRRGSFAYQFPGRGGPPEQGAGRIPICELALLKGGASSPPALAAALELSFRHQPLLERVRKYDDHADAWQNGGFFYWYGQYGRALAAKAAGAAEALKKQREIVLATQEFDGCWVDSHELGRAYGTAMALLTLKLCEP
ncbi:MAG TPA: hypothetical protein VEJ18_00985 [Planctomycetota bacterium]|nr:hypothetical protein [Planctomycetota bacterium]